MDQNVDDKSFGKINQECRSAVARKKPDFIEQRSCFWSQLTVLLAAVLSPFLAIFSFTIWQVNHLIDHQYDDRAENIQPHLATW